MSELKPCPFCGGEMKTAVVTFDEKFYEPPYEQWYLEHVNLNSAADEHCPIPTPDTFYATEAEAVAAWNTRSDDYKQAAEYWQRMYEQAFAERTCEEFGSVRVWQECNVWSHELSCGHEVDTLDMEPPNYCPNCGAKVVSE